VLLTIPDKDNSHRNLNNLLIGPLMTMENADKVIIVDPIVGIAPPPWWRGDKEASQTSQLVATQMRRRIP
jgi:hypothetical protein